MSAPTTSPSAQQAIIDKLPDMVKGVGYREVGGNKPLESGKKLFHGVKDASVALYKAVYEGIDNSRNGRISKGIQPGFANEFPMFANPGMGQNPQAMFNNQIMQILGQVAPELTRNITTTSPLSSGIVPFDLLAPSRLIYPVFSPLRNKFPRPQGQGTSRRAKVITGIAGTSTPSGSNAPIDISISELNGGSLSNWPINLPGSGSQTAVDLNVPYKFFGLTESLSWLAQFAGQGFEDISALANLILLQEFMLAEEFALLNGTATALNAPAAPTLTVRTAGSNETAVPAAGSGNGYYVVTTATNVYGETQMSSSTFANVGTATTDVIDVTLAPVPGAYNYNIYISAAHASGGYSTRTGFFRLVTGQGGSKYTIQGPTLPSSGTNPPASDTGTSATTRYEGINSVLSGHANGSDGAGSTVYPSGFQGGYVNQAVGAKLGVTPLFDALTALWDGPGAYKASPRELIVEGTDARNLADDMLLKNSQTGAYNFFINQSEVGDLRAGAAVSEFQNPVTRDVVKILVHPWLQQGNAFLMSYELPFSWSNVANIWENTMVQDYLSISWPVIDATFRYSIFMYGSLVCFGPQFCGYLGGLQKSDSTPYS